MQPYVEILHVRHESSVAAISTACGPARLLDVGLEERLEDAGARVSISELTLAESPSLNPIAASFRVAGLVSDGVRAALAAGRTPVVLAGSCHVAIGAVAGLPAARRGVVWLDCHGDFNTPETTTSGLLDGTTLATITGRCFAPMSSAVAGFSPVPDEAVVMVGVRELDPLEEELLNESDVLRVSTAEARGEAGRILAAYGESVEGVYLHLDLDALDPSAGVANAFARPGGFSARELEQVVESVARSTPARVLAVTSYDPEADLDGRACEAALGAIRAFASARGATS